MIWTCEWRPQSLAVTTRRQNLPTKEPYPTIHVDGVQARYGPRFVVDWVDLGGLEQQHWIVHDGGSDRNPVCSRRYSSSRKDFVCPKVFGHKKRYLITEVNERNLYRYNVLSNDRQLPINVEIARYDVRCLSPGTRTNTELKTRL